MMKKIAALLLSLGISASANAGIWLEPQIGYAMQTLEASGITADGLKGSMVGGRVGYSFAIFVLAADIAIGSLDAELQGVGNTSDAQRMGLTFMVNPPILPIIAWAGWYSASLDVGGIVDKKYEGDGTKLGVGLTFFPLININAEYFNTNYDKDSLRDKGIMLSISSSWDLL